MGNTDKQILENRIILNSFFIIFFIIITIIAVFIFINKKDQIKIQASKDIVVSTTPTPVIVKKDCDFFTKEDAKAILEEPVQDPQIVGSYPPLNIEICIFPAESPDFPGRVVSISIINQEKFDDSLKKENYTVEKMFEDSKKLYPTITSLTEIGDKAYVSPTDSLNIISFIKGKYKIDVTVIIKSQDKNKKLDAVKNAAKIILNNIEKTL